MKHHIIALVGMAGAGKSTCCQYLKDKGYPVLRFGDQTDLGLKKLHLPLTPKNEKHYREQLRRQLGLAAYAIKLAPRLTAALKQSTTVILDGLYSWEEYLYLQKKFKKIFLLCLYAQSSVRYARLAKRKIRPLTVNQARQRDIAELENLNKGGPIALADFLIDNNCQTKVLFNKLDTIITLINKT